jgi:hypothetical protein
MNPLEFSPNGRVAVMPALGIGRKRERQQDSEKNGPRGDNPIHSHKL